MEADHGAKLKGSADDIFQGSILSFAGIFVAVLQARFAEDGLPWRYFPDFRRTDDQDNTVDNPVPIHIASVYAEEVDVRDGLPRIEVAVPSSQINKIVSGNRSAIRLADRTELFTAHDYLDVQVKCFGKTAGEAATVADIARNQILACTNAIREIFNVHDISLPSLTHPVLQAEAADKPTSYESVISFQIQHKIQWATRPVAPLLQEIALDIQNGGVLLRNIVLRKFTR